MRKLAVAASLLALLAVPLMGAAAATLTPPPRSGLSPDAEIPAELRTTIEAAATAYCNLRPALLAGVLKAESDFGRDPDPSVRSGANTAGAAGPMQIGIGGKAGNTWGGTPVRPVPPDMPYGSDGNGDGLANVYDPADALYGGARYLCALGVAHSEVVAVASYNCGPDCGQGPPRSWPAATRRYVTEVLEAAQGYEATAVTPVAGPVPAGFGTPGPCGRSPSTDYARSLVIATFGITNIGDCAYQGHVENSDHYPDRNGQAHALDVMVGDARALGDQVAAWATQNHQTVNVKYIIWFGRIIDYRTPNPAWDACEDPSSSCATRHFDHVHISFLAGT
jgi:hypothetical protein